MLRCYWNNIFHTVNCSLIKDVGLKRVRFCLEVTSHEVPQQDESRDGGKWIRAAVDRQRFRERIVRMESIIGLTLEKRLIKTTSSKKSSVEEDAETEYRSSSEGCKEA